MLVVIWCFMQPAPYCMSMHMPNLTLAQCERVKPIALRRAFDLGAVKPDAECKEIEAPGVPT